MWRYPNGDYGVTPPARVNFDGFLRRFTDLTPEQLDGIGYNKAVPLHREKYTIYETEWTKGEDLTYRETAVSAVVDEAARDAAQAEAVRGERDRRLGEGDKRVLQLTRQVREAVRSGVDTTALDAELAAWDAHQAALCDVPQQAGFPGSVKWPESPAA